MRPSFVEEDWWVNRFEEHGWTIDDADRNAQIFLEQWEVGVQIAELQLACVLENGASYLCDQASVELEAGISVPAAPIGPKTAAVLRDLAVVAPDLLDGEIRPDATWDSLTVDQRAALEGIENFDGH